MYEWRVFVPLLSGQDQLDVWKLLRLDKHRQAPSIRTDVYIVSTARAGLKLRGKQALIEVKLRGERHESGAELWEKVMSNKLDGASKDDHDALRLELTRKLSVLREKLEKREPPHSLLLESLREALEEASKPLVLLSVRKQRVTRVIDAVTVEQTDLVIDGRPNEHWRTVCFEGELEDVCRLLRTNVGQSDLHSHLTQAGAPRGYPEFVINISCCTPATEELSAGAPHPNVVNGAKTATSSCAAS